jgi:hypothetical protein
MFVRYGKTNDDGERVNGREERRYRHERDNGEEERNNFSIYL